METLEERVKRVLLDEIEIVPYRPEWPRMFREEAEHLRRVLPPELIGRIEHTGSTAVPGLDAKPIVDMLVETPSLDETRRRVMPVLEGLGYDAFWRPTRGDDVPPFYAWFIKRDAAWRRTHHIHVVEPDFEHWDQLLFRDYLIAFPRVAAEYAALKMRLATVHKDDRVAYTEGKSAFILRVTREAAAHFRREGILSGKGAGSRTDGEE